MLARPRIEDLPAYDRVIGDPRVPEHQFPARFRTPEFNELLLHKAIDHWDEHGFGPWNVWLGEELIGRAGRDQLDVRGSRRASRRSGSSRPTTGARATPPRRRGRRSTPAFAFGIEEILAWTMTTNLPSQAVMARLGFEPIGEIDRAGLPHVAFALKR